MGDRDRLERLIGIAGMLSQAILRSLAIRVVVSIYELHYGSGENPGYGIVR
jgi:hypothetical protein